MREFLLLPACAVRLIIDMILALIVLAVALIVVAFVLVTSLIDALLVSIGVRAPIAPLDHEPWWHEEAECYLAEQKVRHR